MSIKEWAKKHRKVLTVCGIVAGAAAVSGITGTVVYKKTKWNLDETWLKTLADLEYAGIVKFIDISYNNEEMDWEMGHTILMDAVKDKRRGIAINKEWF